jgi:hypothetical protein
MAGTATIDPMTELPSPAELPASLRIRRGRIVFRARRPVALVLPLLAVTEVAGVICLLIGATIGWFIIAAPAIGLATTAAVLRPALELTRDGLVQRQYPYSSLTRASRRHGTSRRRTCSVPSTPRMTADGSRTHLPAGPTRPSRW